LCKHRRQQSQRSSSTVRGGHVQPQAMHLIDSVPMCTPVLVYSQQASSHVTSSSKSKFVRTVHQRQWNAPASPTRAACELLCACIESHPFEMNQNAVIGRITRVCWLFALDTWNCYIPTLRAGHRCDARCASLDTGAWVQTTNLYTDQRNKPATPCDNAGVNT
jgi:hypothetical protein